MVNGTLESSTLVVALMHRPCQGNEISSETLIGFLTSDRLFDVPELFVYRL